MLAQKRNKIMYKNIFSNFFFISNWTLDPPTHFQSLFGFFEFFFIYMAPKICFINLAAGNGPKIHNARVNTHTAHTHTRRRCTRTLVNAHTRRLHTHARERTHATAAHAQEMLPRTHTRRQGNARLRMRTRDDHARTRHVDAQARS